MMSKNRLKSYQDEMSIGVLVTILACLFNGSVLAKESFSYKWQPVELSECAEAFENGKVIRQVKNYEHNIFYVSEGGYIYDFYFNTSKPLYRCNRMLPD